ncbi:stress protein [Herbaspirillum seropedicae]|uniref:KGG domain-containing protein n=1 Tax=Herbaspirillum seropedicae TaxID=964 RepID=UPI00031C1EAC|nr:KGG domain-containing protein [Herbaspirillum seropedicae]AKN65773.1 stress protein [Herbaspirillum seropedicae]AON54592.1 stress protein [Herbaspirillum seropedicae]MDR6394361.1 general stress protein YciG [Herbaspirillum seropedicae]NQE28929.1 stress protein [Herbaspirillum seropedicae]QDD64679.1 stress protein [Herbaspirillum seropedicae]
MANAQNPGNSNRGFAAMDREKQRQIASMGGKAAHAKGAAHEFTSAEAREAGRKGGLNSHGRKNAAAAAAAAQNGASSSAQPQMNQAAPQDQARQESQSSAQQPQQSDNTAQQQG